MSNNKVILTGNLGAAPKLIEKGDKLFVAFSMATQDGYRNKDNEWTSQPSVWHQVLAFNNTLVEMAQSLTKGQRVEITGTLSYRNFKALLDNDETVTKQEAAIIARKIELKPLTTDAQP